MFQAMAKLKLDTLAYNARTEVRILPLIPFSQLANS